MVKDILLLGDTRLYLESSEVREQELEYIKTVVQDMHDTLMNYRSVYGAGRAISAPQIGVMKRLIYMNIDNPILFINPSISFPSDESMVVMDDCMSFPNLVVCVKRHKKCIIKYKDLKWKDQILYLDGDLSELIQHQFDHLNGVLATMKGLDNRSLYINT